MSQLEPYYHSDRVIIYWHDCRVIMPLLFDLVDCVIADPPYEETSLAWDRRVTGWLPLAGRRLAPHGSLWCFGSMRFFLKSSAEFDGWQPAQDLIWEKQNGSGFVADRFRRVHETVIQFYPAGQRWSDIYKSVVTTGAMIPKKTDRASSKHTRAIKNVIQPKGTMTARIMRSVIYARNTQGYAEHETQKPLAILDPLIRYSCPPGGIVLDPFMGSGSTLLAALDSGRRAIGIEISQEHCDTAIRRLETLA